uniref:DUF4139 domain-containing protein n=1 Tax=Mycena chlorophos TaxID=658473 RepID=A0ABQ0KXM5_MYCCL|nr:predicted protein [Mycena chlorophos]
MGWKNILPFISSGEHFRLHRRALQAYLTPESSKLPPQVRRRPNARGSEIRAADDRRAAGRQIRALSQRILDHGRGIRHKRARNHLGGRRMGDAVARTFKSPRRVRLEERGPGVDMFPFPIKAVTVYKSSRAEVVRVFRIELQVHTSPPSLIPRICIVILTVSKSGTTNIQINELPTCVDTQSVRVSGLGAEAKLLNVACTTGTHGAPSVLKAAVSATVHQLRAQHTKFEGQKRMREDATALLRSYAETLSGELISPTLMTDFIGSLVQSDNERLAAVAEIDARLESIDHQIEEELEKDALRKRHAMGLVTVDIGSDKPMNIELTLTYIINDASWSIAYELRASTENGKPSSSVSLHYRPRIVQTTGEDWTNITLTLSTGDLSLHIQNIPEPLRPRTIPAHGTNIFEQLRSPKTPHNDNGGQVFGLPGFSSYAGSGAMRYGASAASLPSIPRTAQSPFTMESASTTPPPMVSGAPGQTFSSTTWFGSRLSMIQPGIAAPPTTNTTTVPFFGSTPRSLFANAPAPATLFGTPANSMTKSIFGRNGNEQPGTTTAGLFGPTVSAPSMGGLLGAAQTAEAATHVFGQPACATGVGLFGSTKASPFTTGTATEAAAEPALVITTPAQTQGASKEDSKEIAVGSQADPLTGSIFTSTPPAPSFSINGKTSIRSDGTVHQVAVAELPFEAQITHVCAPRADAQVHIQGSMKNTSADSVLAGPVQVLLDNRFVSQMWIKEIAPGDMFTSMLGDDPKVRIAYKRAWETEAIDSGLVSVDAGALHSTTFRTQITIHNMHAFALANLVVWDIIPTSEDPRAKVLLHKPEGLVDAKDGQVVEENTDGLSMRWGKTADGHPGEKEGRVEWVGSVGAGKEVQLETEYELRAPSNANWVEILRLFA